jgi:hypothetical protein
MESLELAKEHAEAFKESSKGLERSSRARLGQALLVLLSWSRDRATLPPVRLETVFTVGAIRLVVVHVDRQGRKCARLWC